jgi:hypothetical protein
MCALIGMCFSPKTSLSKTGFRVPNFSDTLLRRLKKNMRAGSLPAKALDSVETEDRVSPGVESGPKPGNHLEAVETSCPSTIK